MSKNNLRDKLTGDELDLSMLSLTDVPVKEIAALPRATKIDLSNNGLTRLPPNFASSLANIVKLDLSSNKLKELPENIHLLQNLKQLDLYNNQLKELPVTFCQLRKLRWLDLKGNDLSPAIRKVAGECLDQKECEAAAKNVVEHLRRKHIQMEAERMEKLRKEEEMEAKRKLAEERKLAKKKAEKEKAKDKKKAEQAAAAKKVVANGKAPVPQKVAAPKVSKKEKKQQKLKESPGWSFLGWLNMLLLLGLVGAVASGVYLYTDGDLSGGALEEAYTKLINNSNKLLEVTVEAFQPENLKTTAEAVSTSVVGAFTSAWSTLQVYTGDLNIYIEPVVEVLTPAAVWLKEMIILGYNWVCDSVDWAALLEVIKSAWRFLQEKYVNLCVELNKNEAFMSVIDTMRTHAASVLEFLSILWASICKQLAVVMDYVQEEGPGILATVKEQAAGALHAAKQSLEGLVK